MLEPVETDLLTALTGWIQQEKTVKAAVLFGSRARRSGIAEGADRWSDIDLHIVTTDAARIVQLDWQKTLPNYHLCLKVVRPATGTVTKFTLLFMEGEVDLILVPRNKATAASLAMIFGFHLSVCSLRAALDGMSTIMKGGYFFLKGERNWGRFYERVVKEMPGVRISDDEARRMAAESLCDILWMLQKLERGELIAAQRHLHMSINEINIRLLHESRTRQHSITFQQARRVEMLMTLAEWKTVRVSAELDRDQLRLAAWRAFGGLTALMRDLVPAWQVPPGMMRLLEPYRGHVD